MLKQRRVATQVRVGIWEWGRAGWWVGGGVAWVYARVAGARPCLARQPRHRALPSTTLSSTCPPPASPPFFPPRLHMLSPAGTVNLAMGTRYVSGGVLRVLRQWPGQYQAHAMAANGSSQLLEGSAAEPTYQVCGRWGKTATSGCVRVVVAGGQWGRCWCQMCSVQHTRAFWACSQLAAEAWLAAAIIDHPRPAVHAVPRCATLCRSWMR